MAADSRPSSSKEWMFCPLTGSLLQLDARKGIAYSELSNYSVDLAELEGRVVTVHETDMEDYAQRYGLNPLVPSACAAADADAAAAAGGGRTRATVDEPCPKCGRVGLDFYTLQLRSADEGQTVFYECPGCKHRWSQNN